MLYYVSNLDSDATKIFACIDQVSIHPRMVVPVQALEKSKVVGQESHSIVEARHESALCSLGIFPVIGEEKAGDGRYVLNGLHHACQYIGEEEMSKFHYPKWRYQNVP